MAWIIGTIGLPVHLWSDEMAADRYNVPDNDWQQLRSNFLRLSDRLNKIEAQNTSLLSQITALQQQVQQLQIALGTRNA